MRRQLLPAVRLFVIFTIACGLLYPLAVTGVAQGFFGHRANGSKIQVDGEVVGSSLLGQSFTAEDHFWPRPSAAGALAAGATDVDGAPADPSELSSANSGGSNLGPTNEELLYGTETGDGVQQRVDAYRAANGLGPDDPVPVDAVTSSGSGLDPMISVANARTQARRVAIARALRVDDVLSLVDQHTVGRTLGVFGEPGVNVLELNLALDGLTDGSS
jgi:K+-transporting ATPase ATPase C chain